MFKPKVPVIVVISLAAVAAILSYLAGTSFVTQSSSNKWSGVADCNYLVFKDGATTYAKNCYTGVIDYSGTNAGTVIQNAIMSGAKVFIKQGDYTISSTIHLLHGTTLVGENPSQAVTNGRAGTHLRIANGANVDMLAYTGTDRAFFITIRDIFLDGNKSNNSLGSGIYLNKQADDVLIENIYVDGFAEHGLKFDEAWNYRLFGNTLEHNRLDGMYVKSGTDLKVIGNKFLTNSQFGVEVGTSSSGVGAFSFIGNYVQGNAKHGTRLVNVQRANLEGNTWEINSNGNVGVYNSLQLENNCSYTKIVGNQFIGSSIARAAIAIIHSTSNKVIIMANAMDSHTLSPPIFDVGTGTIIRNNIGYVTENSGTGMITSGSTSVVITHGLSYTPAASDITITPSNKSTNDYGNIWISNITPTQFTVNVRNDPGPSNLIFSWAVRRI